MLSQTHNTVKTYLHMSIFQPTLTWQDFSWKQRTILGDEIIFNLCLDVKVEFSIIFQLQELSSKVTSHWMNFIH
jgi:hypothetical protein